MVELETGIVYPDLETIWNFLLNKYFDIKNDQQKESVNKYTIDEKLYLDDLETTLLIYGYNPSGAERILIAKYTDYGVDPTQILIERWTEGLFAGKMSASFVQLESTADFWKYVNVKDLSVAKFKEEFTRRAINLMALAEISDRMWRSMNPGIGNAKGVYITLQEFMGNSFPDLTMSHNIDSELPLEI
ncbi:hypothetical protein KW795_02135 [Candidatus Microgenomates bacterium]|nr:hypothetical protein [Candidatus Microgenomates bacterium]